MYDIEHLEQQWRRYKHKRIGVVVTVVVVLFVGMVGYFWWATNTRPSLSDGFSATHPEHLSHSVPQLPAASVLGESVSLPITQSDTATLPAVHKGWSMSFEGADKPRAADTPLVSSTKHVDIQVRSKKTANTVHDIEKRFQFAKDKDDALFLARYYYDKQEYQMALKWALETNKLDSDIEESWLIFGRAKARLGLRMEAIRVLQAYYDRTGSRKAKQLLDKVRRGKGI
jgi:predicted Zn-dependent protease